MTTTSIYCIVSTYHQAEQIADQLKAEHFKNTDISVLFDDRMITRVFSNEQGTVQRISTDSGPGVGAGIGGMVGGALGWLAGIGAMAIPGVGPFIAAGPIMTALGGAIVGAALNGAAVGAANGGISSSLISLGVSETMANHYEGKVKGGSVLVSVHTVTSEESRSARQIFDDAAGEYLCVAESPPQTGISPTENDEVLEAARAYLMKRPTGNEIDGGQSYQRP